MPGLRHAARPRHRGAPGPARARVHPGADRRLQVEGRDQDGARGAVRATACWPCPATRASTTSATCSSTWCRPLAILLAARGHRARRAALAAPARRPRSAGGPPLAARRRRPPRRRPRPLRPVIAAGLASTPPSSPPSGSASSRSSPPACCRSCPATCRRSRGVSFADIQEGRGRSAGARPRAALLPRLHGDVRRARHDRHRPRPDAPGQPRAAAPDLRA